MNINYNYLNKFFSDFFSLINWFIMQKLFKRRRRRKVLKWIKIRVKILYDRLNSVVCCETTQIAAQLVENDNIAANLFS